MISIKNLIVQFGSLRAVDGLSLEVPEGRLFGLLGSNGAGKSTTIACIGGLLAPTSGSVQLLGKEVSQSPLEIRRLLGIVPQKLALYMSLTVLQNLQLACGFYGLVGKKLQERVDWGLELAQLKGREKAVVATLSGGMQRRLNLACSLVHAPKLVICDEPTTGVDPQSRNHLFESIRQLHREGRTIIYTTHYMEEVEALCQDVAIVDHGRVVAVDSLKAMVAPKSGGRRFQLELSGSFSEEQLWSSLQKLGVPIQQLSAEKRSLEEVFLEITGRSLRDSL
jgi:ABC-2 type transport system ATP-binding protein